MCITPGLALGFLVPDARERSGCRGMSGSPLGEMDSACPLVNEGRMAPLPASCLGQLGRQMVQGSGAELPAHHLGSPSTPPPQAAAAAGGAVRERLEMVSCQARGSGLGGWPVFIAFAH